MTTYPPPASFFIKGFPPDQPFEKPKENQPKKPGEEGLERLSAADERYAERGMVTINR